MRLFGLLLVLWAGMAGADPIRFATYHAELSRKGPGLLLADILDRDEQVVAVAEVIVHARPDVLHLAGFDHDYEGHALTAFVALLGEMGLSYPYTYAPRPNAGLPSGVDLDGNGHLGEARDSQGYGRFTGDGGMAVLSRLPLGEARDFSAFLWRDLPGHMAPVEDGAPFPSEEAFAVQRLSSVGHWAVPIQIGARQVEFLVWQGTTPVFDGPEDLNGRRGGDEVRFWQRLLDGALPFAAPARPVVIAGGAGVDPVDGEGRHEAIQALLDDPRLRDPGPTSAGGTAAANPEHAGNPALDTVDYGDPSPGNLRNDYVLVDAGLRVVEAGVMWPAPEDPMAQVVADASRHRLVWVDVLLP